jgi:hypothetical protein
MFTFYLNSTCSTGEIGFAGVTLQLKRSKTRGVEIEAKKKKSCVSGNGRRMPRHCYSLQKVN